MKRQWYKILEWFGQNEVKLICFLGIVLISIMAFVFGVLKGAGLSQKPIMVMRPESPPIVIEKGGEGDIISEKDCMYVGSVKGKKYYPPTCSFAKKIAKENLRCFTSDEDAKNKGYTKSLSCK